MLFSADKYRKRYVLSVNAKPKKKRKARILEKPLKRAPRKGLHAVKIPIDSSKKAELRPKKGRALFWAKSLLVCLLLFALTFRVVQMGIYRSLENNIPKAQSLILDQNQWLEFEIRGNPSLEQMESLKRALSLLPTDILFDFSHGKNQLNGKEPKLSIFVLGEENFSLIAPFYHDKQAIAHLEGFYTDGKVFIRNQLESIKFFETISHELVHAFSDYLVQNSNFGVTGNENGNLLNYIGTDLWSHKRKQALKVFAGLGNETQIEHYANLYDTLFKSHLRIKNKGKLLEKDKMDIFKSLSCCFVSLYSFVGDYRTGIEDPSEYWAENYTIYLINPEILKRKDPVLFVAIDAFDTRLRVDHDLEGGITAFLQVLNL